MATLPMGSTAVSAEDVARVIRDHYCDPEIPGSDLADFERDESLTCANAILALFTPAPITADAGKGEP